MVRVPVHQALCYQVSVRGVTLALRACVAVLGDKLVGPARDASRPHYLGPFCLQGFPIDLDEAPLLRDLQKAELLFRSPLWPRLFP